MFDGRKDNTLVSGPVVRKIIKVEHVVIVEQPGNKYRAHVTPASGKSESVATAILD